MPPRTTAALLTGAGEARWTISFVFLAGSTIIPFCFLTRARCVGSLAASLPKMPLFRKAPNKTANKMRNLSTVVALPQRSFSGKLPRKPCNKDVRTREYLTDKEVVALVDAARNTGRHSHRHASLILIAYRHALRVSELTALRWDQVDLGQGAPACPPA